MYRPVLVTGAAGFIGFHTCARLLADGRKVVGVDNLNDYYDPGLKMARREQLERQTGFSFVKADIADRAAMETLWESHGPFREVIHLAAQAGVRYSLQDPYAYIHSNCLGHLTILEMCRHTPGFRHLVYASSSSVYGGNTQTPYAVNDRVDTPVSLYAATKRADELMSHSYSHLFGISQTGLRFFTVYGPWGRPDMSPYIFASAIAEGRKLPVFNHGDMKRDFTYIDDIVSGTVAALGTPPDSAKDGVPHRVLNLGNNKSVQLLDFIAEFEKAFGKKAEIELLEMQPGDVRETCADIEETTQTIGYRPTTPIGMGVPLYVTWFREYYRDKKQ